MIYKFLFLFLFLFSLGLHAQTLSIALSTNVSYAMQTIQKEFSKQYPDIKLRLIIGSSGKLTAQIRNGAPYDVFMSANMIYPMSLYQKKLTLNEPVVYAKGSLSYLSTKKRDFVDGLKLLKSDTVTKIAIANPKVAPYGKASYEALQNTGFLREVKHKLVYAESAAQTLSYTMKVVDIGFVATSSLYSSVLQKYKLGVHYAHVDPSLYEPIQQGIVILKKAKDKKSAQAFYDFILSEKAKAIFVDFGYIVL